MFSLKVRSVVGAVALLAVTAGCTDNQVQTSPSPAETTVADPAQTTPVETVPVETIPVADPDPVGSAPAEGDGVAAVIAPGVLPEKVLDFDLKQVGPTWSYSRGTLSTLETVGVITMPPGSSADLLLPSLEDQSPVMDGRGTCGNWSGAIPTCLFDSENHGGVMVQGQDVALEEVQAVAEAIIPVL